MSDSLIGKKIESMQLPISTGGQFSMPKDLEGQWTILYFYPKDDTPGCTVQACSYRDHWDEFKSLNAQVIGVSKDDLNSHEQFISKFSLNFPLIADTEKKLAEFLKVQSRDSFLIDTEGTVRMVWRGVNPQETVEETKKALQELAQ